MQQMKAFGKKIHTNVAILLALFVILIFATIGMEVGFRSKSVMTPSKYIIGHIFNDFFVEFNAFLYLQWDSEEIKKS